MSNEEAHLNAQLKIKDDIIAKLSHKIGILSVENARLETERDTVMQAYNHALVDDAPEEEEEIEEKGE